MILTLYPTQYDTHPLTTFGCIPRKRKSPCDFWSLDDWFDSELVPQFRNKKPLLDLESAIEKVEKSHSLKLTDNTFEVKLDVSKFTPSEISVKVQEDSLIIEGKHEEKDGKDKIISRNFIRKFQIPDGVKLDTMKSTYTKDGQLQIGAAREIVKPPPPVDTNIPITFVRKENSSNKNAKSEVDVKKSN